MAQRPKYFQTTRWSLVQRAGSSDPEAEQALEELCERYWPALRNFAVRMGCSAHDADDMAQGFFVQVIKKDLFSKADQTKGKLRTFLITAFRRYLQDQWTREQAKKRGGGVSFVALDEIRDASDEKQSVEFDREWAAQVMDLSMQRLRERYQKENREQLFEALRPCLLDELPAGGMKALCEKTDLTVGATKVALHRLRKRLGEALRQELLETLGAEDDVEAELRYLLAVVS